MDIPLILQVREDYFLNIVDLFGYTIGDSDTMKQLVLLISTQIIEDAQKYGARPLQENRVPMKAQKGKIGISFSLIFKDRNSPINFVEDLKL